MRLSFQSPGDKKIKAFFSAAIKEVCDDEMALMNRRTSEEKTAIANHDIFAMIGGGLPAKSIEATGIKIG